MGLQQIYKNNLMRQLFYNHQKRKQKEKVRIYEQSLYRWVLRHNYICTTSGEVIPLLRKQILYTLSWIIYVIN